MLSVVRLHHNAWGMLPIPSLHQLNKQVLPLRANRFLPTLAYVSRKYSGQIHNTSLLPTDGSNCKDQKNWRPKPTQNSGWISLIVSQNNEFVREGNKQLRGAPPEEENKEEKANVIKWMNQFPFTSWLEEATFTQEMLLFTLFSLSVLLVSSLYLGIFVWISLSMNPPFLIYSSLHHISTIHPYLTNLLL